MTVKMRITRVKMNTYLQKMTETEMIIVYLIINNK